MAKFLKLRDKGIIVNTENITMIDTEDRIVRLSDGDFVSISREYEWNKLMDEIQNNSL